jgi:glycosyltransferase involved in cell wall biosynthesis
LVVCERTDPRQHRVPAAWGALRALTYPRADVLVVQSEGAAAWFQPLVRSNVAVIPNVVLPSVAPKVGHRERADAVLAVGHLEASKDHRTLVEAVARLKDRYPALQLTIFGEGPERTALTTLVRSRGLEGRVLLPGFTTGVPQRLRDFDLFACASRYEGFPNALAEAMSAGLPVIASSGPGHGDLVVDGVNGRMFPVGNVDALASTVAALHGDPATREALAAAARGVSNVFSETRIMALWANLFARAGRSSC